MIFIRGFVLWLHYHDKLICIGFDWIPGIAERIFEFWKSIERENQRKEYWVLKNNWGLQQVNKGPKQGLKPDKTG